jgi:phosphoglycolate phosphatase
LSQTRISAVLFDLDGTLLDTAPDMAPALNQLRSEQDLPALPYEQVRAEVSNGSSGLLRLAFPAVQGAPLEDLRTRLLDLYRARIAESTRPFPGFDLVLPALSSRGLRWGVVTNKPAFLTEPLLAALGLAQQAAVVVSGDTMPNRKPHPEPLLHAAQVLAVAPTACVYVGDAQRDIQSAQAAGMSSLVARYGYLGPGDDPLAWAPDACIDTPTGLLHWLDAQ